MRFTCKPILTKCNYLGGNVGVHFYFVISKHFMLVHLDNFHMGQLAKYIIPLKLFTPILLV